MAVISCAYIPQPGLRIVQNCAPIDVGIIIHHTTVGDTDATIALISFVDLPVLITVDTLTDPHI
jgi:hypothetical protein